MRETDVSVSPAVQYISFTWLCLLGQPCVLKKYLCFSAVLLSGVIDVANYWTYTAKLRSLIHSGRDKMVVISQTTFLVHFLAWKCINFDQDFIEVCSQWSNKQYSSIGSNNGFAPVRRQAIIWINDGLVYWRTYIRISVSLSKSHLYGSNNFGYCNQTIEIYQISIWCYFYTKCYVSMIDIKYYDIDIVSLGCGTTTYSSNGDWYL